VLTAIGAGKSFSLVRAYGEPAHLEFTAAQGETTVSVGERMTDTTRPITIHARVPQAPGARLVLYRDGRPLAQGTGALSTGVDPAPAVYRVEVTLPTGTAPWIVSNAIVVGPAGPPRAVPAGLAVDDGTDPTPVQPLELDSPWTIERDATSAGDVRAENGAQQFTFHLGGGEPSGQYAAMTASVHSLVGADRVTFTARASKPMRVSVQLRLPGGKDGQRWRQSVYLDETPRSIAVRLQDLVAVGMTTSRRPFVAPIQGLLFVVDTVNTRPGTEGTIWISGIGVGGR